MPWPCRQRCSDERGKVRDRRLKRVEAVIEWQERVAAKCDDDRLVLG
jgi:hypothetical protein